MLESAPLVSICIPVYNAAPFIRYTIACCLNQTYKNIEIIFSDNCSTDGTDQIIKSYQDTRIKFYQNAQNIGLVGNYIQALAYATGKYMGFLGADDAMDSTAIEKCVAILESPQYQNVVLVNTHIHVIDENNKVIFEKRSLIKSGRVSGYWGIRSNFLYGSNTIGEPNGSFFRKATYDKIPNPKFKNANMWTMDLDMKFELLLQGEGYMIAEPLGMFRVSTQSTSRKELRFSQARLFREYVFTLYKDKRYKLSFIWVLIAAITSFFLQIARNIFYLFHLRKQTK